MAVTKRRIAKIATRAIKGSALGFVALASCQAHAHPTDINGCVTITKPGAYVLAGDIVYSGVSQSCITVMVSNVSINLDGHTMSWVGPRTSGVWPDAISSANDTGHVTVRNGTISGFGSGVQLFGTGSTVKDVHVEGPCPCEGVGIEAHGVVKDNVVSVFGLKPDDFGILGGGVIEGNYVYDTRPYGIVVIENSTARGNTVTGTGGSPGIGMYVNCPATVAHNTITGSSGKNLDLNGDGCVVKDNTAP